MTTLQRMTYDDLMSLPNDENLHELVRGEIVCMPPPKADHGYIEAALVEAISRYLDDRALSLGWQKRHGRPARDRAVGRLHSGEAGVRFSLPDDPDQLRGLDVCYLSPAQVERQGPVTASQYLTEMPVLAAEVISPSESADYINEKVTDYLAAGARLVWLLFPKTHTVTVFRPDGTGRTIPASGVLDGEDVLPGFSEDVAYIFGAEGAPASADGEDQ